MAELVVDSANESRNDERGNVLYTPPMFTFRRLQTTDFELLTLWRNSPHIAVWWDGATDLAGITEKYLPRTEPDNPTRMYIIELDGEPFGRIQYEQTCTWLPDFAADVANVDYAIGSQNHIGQGLGPMMITQFIDDIIAKDGRFIHVLSDPEAANKRSVGALEKAGFRKTETREIGGKPYQFLMRPVIQTRG